MLPTCSSRSFFPWFFLAIGSFLFSPYPPASGSSVGVNYGRLADNLPSPSQVVDLLRSNNVGKVRIFDADQEVLNAFAGSGISLIVGVPNELLQTIATSQDASDQWIEDNILPQTLRRVQISYISAGNEISDNSDYQAYLLPAMENIQNSLKSFSVEGAIKISTAHAATVLDANSFPPSNGRFNSFIEGQMSSILQFLSQTESSFMANVYPFLAYTSAPTQIDLSYALFGEGAEGVDDAGDGLHYSNLFDAQVDTFVAAMSSLGYPNIPIIITETGWPSGGDQAATVANAQVYNSNLVSHAQAGTPQRPGFLDIYLFALFNEDQKPGSEIQRNFGLFYPNQSNVYDIAL